MSTLVKRSICARGCCLECPFEKVIFPELWRVLDYLNTFELISFAILGGITMSYFCLPKARSTTTSVVTCV